MKKYKTDRWNTDIKEVDIIRETEHFVIVPREGRVKEWREAKQCDYYQYHDTWEGAHKWLLEKATARIESLKRNLEDAAHFLAKVKTMVKP